MPSLLLYALDGSVCVCVCGESETKTHKLNTNEMKAFFANPQIACQENMTRSL